LTKQASSRILYFILFFPVLYFQTAILNLKCDDCTVVNRRATRSVRSRRKSASPL